MDLWIRSQDKELLVDAKGFELQQHYKDSPCQIFAVWDSNYMCVGTYKTKERALEVLDEIQGLFIKKDIVKSQLTKDGLTMVTMPITCIVYEMPTE